MSPPQGGRKSENIFKSLLSKNNNMQSLQQERVNKRTNRLNSTEELIFLDGQLVLKKYPIKIPLPLLYASKAELLRQSKTIHSKFTPGRESHSDLPATWLVCKQLANKLLEPSGTDLSFIRASRPQGEIFADNLHYDSRYVGYSKKRKVRGTFWRPSKHHEIWRQLININDQPRHLQVITTPLNVLEKRKIDIYQERPIGKTLSKYQSIEVMPKRVLTRKIPTSESIIITIPPYDGKNLYVLEFWSSCILHAGVTAGKGQFIAAAAKWVKPNNKEKGGYYAS
mgnify:CR=1 FL=1